MERLRKHFVKSCPKSPFHKDSKEYEELLEQVNAPQMEHKKKSYIPQGMFSRCAHDSELIMVCVF